VCWLNLYKESYFDTFMVKIIDRTKEKKREDKLYRSMLEKAVSMFEGRNVTSLDGSSITFYDEDQGVMRVDVISSLIYLYDARYLARVKKLAREYESMAGEEFTINLEYK